MNELHKTQEERNDYRKQAEIWKERAITVALFLVVVALTALVAWTQ